YLHTFAIDGHIVTFEGGAPAGSRLVLTFDESGEPIAVLEAPVPEPAGESIGEMAVGMLPGVGAAQAFIDGRYVAAAGRGLLDLAAGVKVLIKGAKLVGTGVRIVYRKLAGCSYRVLRR